MTATLPTDRGSRPYRVVDRFQRGWLTHTDPCTTHPPIGDGRRWTLADLEAERAPLRPVVAMPEADAAILVDVLTAAGRDAVATVTVALHQLSMRCFGLDGHDGRLLAGRPDSWESHLLPRLAWEIGVNVSSRRVNPRGLAAVERVIRGWVFDTDRYVEVAENLASVLAEVVRAAGGYERVADQWVRQHALAEDVEGYVTSKL